MAWHLKRNEIQNSDPSETKTKFIYNISSSGYRKDWGDVYEKPDFFARLKAFFCAWCRKSVRSAPRVSSTTPAVEQLYMHSFNETLDPYRNLLLAQRKADSNCQTTTSTRGE